MDCEYYFNRYPESREEHIDPLTHFIEHGAYCGQYVSKSHEDALRGVQMAPDIRLMRGNQIYLVYLLRLTMRQEQVLHLLF